MTLVTDFVTPDQSRPAPVFDAAKSLDDVMEAWNVVYRAYHGINLIPENRHEIHTLPHAIREQAVVVCGRMEDRIVCTMSAYLDNEDGLPLDALYSRELDELRRQGRKLVEVGLLGDRRRSQERARTTILELVRHTCCFALHEGATDAVIGVHPHHAKFYLGLLGFTVAGPQRIYPSLRGAPVMLLRLDWETATKQEHIPLGLSKIIRNVVPAEVFADRIRLTPETIAGTPIAEYLAERMSQSPISQRIAG